jgi:GNAT superfamily N-acetyltransferase
MVRIELVRDAGAARAVYELAYEFVDWLRERYPEMSAEIDTYLTHQKFDAQIKEVLIHYNPPRGECLLAVLDGMPVGILMLKDLGDGVCEMNRMFVRQSARGMGVGRMLVARLKERAREMGYTSMVLSALPRHHEALSLYRAMEFQPDDRQREAGNSNNAILMRLDLQTR